MRRTSLDFAGGLAFERGVPPTDLAPFFPAVAMEPRLTMPDVETAFLVAGITLVNRFALDFFTADLRVVAMRPSPPAASRVA